MLVLPYSLGDKPAHPPRVCGMTMLLLSSHKRNEADSQGNETRAIAYKPGALYVCHS